jgi:uncharacterized protein YabE (DUF348 family)
MDKLRKAYESFFSVGPKVVFIVILILMGTTVSIEAAKKTIVVSIDGKETEIVTFRKTFKDALKANNIVLGPKDKAIPSVDTRVNKEDRIDIEKAVNVIVAVDGQELKIQTTEDTVDKIFEEEGIELKDSDKILPSRTIPISDGLKLSVTRIDTRVIKENIPIEFATVIKKDDESLSSSTKILQQGELGEKVLTTKIVYEDGREIERNVVSEVIAKEPTQKIVAVGTLSALNLSRGGTVLYKNVVKMQATAYTADFASTGKRPGDKNFGKTATGSIAKRNEEGYSSIAVDPRVIPLGTKLYIEGYGYGIAEDTGSAIKGNIIDVFFNSAEECYNWGRRNVNVYIMK